MSKYISNLSKKSYKCSYYRNFIPKDLQIRFGGKGDFRLSLRYVRKEDTQILCLKLKQITDLLFTDIRNGMKSLSLDDIKEILRIEVRKQIKHSQHFYLRTNVFDEEHTKQGLELVSTREKKMKEDLSGKNIKGYEKELDKKLEGILSSLDIEIDTNSINYLNLRRQFIQLYILRFDWIKTLINETGRYEEDDFRREVDEKLKLGLFPDLQSTLPPPIIENYNIPEPIEPYIVSSNSVEVKYNSVGSTTTPPNSLLSTPISKGLDLFIGEKEDIRDKTEDEIRNSVKFLIECFGDIPIGDITKEKSNIIKSHIKRYPKNRTKLPRYRDEDFHSLMEMKIPQKDIIHLTTINKHLGNLSSFMIWCVNNGYCNTNPFTGMKMKQKKSVRDERDRFTEQEIKDMFSKHNYLHLTKVEKDSYSKYWVPLIGCFTGMRCGEICSLYLDNVKEIKGNHRNKRWYFDILEEPNRPDKKLKNKSSRRIVPIHDTLIDLGFIDFIKLLKKDPERKRVFEELEYREGTYIRSISRFWNNRYLPLLGIKTDKNGFHSFRHSFIDTLKQLGVEPHFINELVGHSQGDISSDRYGKNYNPDILYNKCIKRVVYQTSHTRGINFLSLKLDWKKIIG
jgi:integrase